MEWMYEPISNEVGEFEPLDGSCVIYTCWARYHDKPPPGACFIRFCWTKSCWIDL